ncbi:hypothetical protein ACOMHN_006509 [Nucella lapillus]
MEGERSGVSRRSSVTEAGEEGGGGESEGSSVQLAHPSWDRLVPLRTRRDTQRFLRVILEQFVQTVDVETPGLLEELRAARVLSDRDAESLAGIHLPTPSEKARRLWDIFTEIDHKRFVRKVVPCLCTYYWHIIPERFWLPGDAPGSQTWSLHSGHGSRGCGGGAGCVRCAIQRRIRPPDLADLLTTARLISCTTHRDIVSRYRTSPTNWSKIFRAFKKLAGRDVRSHEVRMRKLMIRHSLSVPDNLSQLMTRGFPCTCHSRRKIPSKLPGIPLEPIIDKTVLLSSAQFFSKWKSDSIKDTRRSTGVLRTLDDVFPAFKKPWKGRLLAGKTGHCFLLCPFSSQSSMTVSSVSDPFPSSLSIDSSSIPDSAFSDSHHLSDYSETCVKQAFSDPWIPDNYEGRMETKSEENDHLEDYTETTLQQVDYEFYMAAMAMFCLLLFLAVVIRRMRR